MKFRKKPIEVEAKQITQENFIEVADWAGYAGVEVTEHDVCEYLLITTLEGSMKAEIGDWVIRGVKGEFYPCKPDIFKQTYEPVGLWLESGETK